MARRPLREAELSDQLPDAPNVQVTETADGLEFAPAPVDVAPKSRGTRVSKPKTQTVLQEFDPTNLPKPAHIQGETPNMENVGDDDFALEQQPEVQLTAQEPVVVAGIIPPVLTMNEIANLVKEDARAMQAETIANAGGTAQAPEPQVVVNNVHVSETQASVPQTNAPQANTPQLSAEERLISRDFLSKTKALNNIPRHVIESRLDDIEALFAMRRNTTGAPRDNATVMLAMSLWEALGL